MNSRRSLVHVVLIMGLISILMLGVGEARSQDKPQAAPAVAKPAVEKAPAPPVVAPMTTTLERTSVYVLLAWIWLSIAVLLWLLRLRVREADRVFHMGLDRAPEKKVPDSGR